MDRTRYRSTLASVLAPVALLALAVPVQAVNVPDGGAVPAGGVFVVHFRIIDGCDEQPTDTLEISIPESVTKVIPEAVPGWSVETETVDREGTPEVTLVRWTGGLLPDGQLLEFGLRAQFPDEPGATIEFPAVQRCGDMALAWNGSSDETSAPTIMLADRLGQQDLQALGGSVEELIARVEELETRVGNIDGPNLRDRISELEADLEGVTRSLEALEQEVAGQE